MRERTKSTRTEGGRKEEGDVRGEVKRRVDEIKFEKMGTVCRQ